VARDPTRATALQYFQGAEQDALDRKLTPVTLDFLRGQVALAREGLARLRAYDGRALGPEDRVSYAAMEWQLDDVVRGEPHLGFDFPYEQFGGVQRRLPDFLANTHPLRNRRDAENFIARLEQVGATLDAATAEARAQGERGVLPPDFILDATIAQMERFAAAAPDKSYIVTSFAERLTKIEGLPAADRAALTGRVAQTVASSVYPAWQRALALLKAQRPQATSDAGLWRLKGGDAAYRHLLRRYTTTEMTPEEVHQTGLAQVARIEKEMDSLLRSLGYTEGTVNDRFKKMREDAPAIPGDARAAILAEYEKLIRDAEARSARIFDLRPKAPVVVQREPEFAEAHADARYSAPARDGS
jgi:uncharacterized protein (DUF885 family)